jgi:hypothetical protein
MELLVRVLCVFFTMLAALSAGVIIVKVPLLARPVGAGTYVYADSFVVPGGSSDVATTLGICLLNYDGSVGTNTRFGFFQDAGTNLYL